MRKARDRRAPAGSRPEAQLKPVILAGAVLLSVVAGWTDLRSRRIPNWLTVPGLLLGLAANSVLSGWGGLKASLLGAAVGLALLLPFVLLRSLGAGDWKLAGSLGAFAGPGILMDLLLGSVFVAGVMAVALVIYKGRVRQTIRNIGHILISLVTFRLPGSRVSLDNPDSLKVPYGVALAFTVVLYGILWKMGSCGLGCCVQRAPLFADWPPKSAGPRLPKPRPCCPLMFMILLGIFWFGQAFSIYGAITRAAQEGARAGAAPYCTTCASPNSARDECGQCGQRRSTCIQTRSHENTSAVSNSNFQRLYRSHGLDFLCDRVWFQCLCAGPVQLSPNHHWWHRGLRHLGIVSIPVPVLAAFHLPEQAANLADRVGARADGDPVTPSPRLRRCFRVLAGLGWRDDRAAQLVEFAVALPLLVVFVVGIFDFSSAFTLKQKLTNAARDGARVAAADPANDLSAPIPVPVSVNDAFQVGLQQSGWPTTSTSAASCHRRQRPDHCVGADLDLYRNRQLSSRRADHHHQPRLLFSSQPGATLPSVTCTSQSPGAQTAVIGTCVSIQYAYPWRFGKVASLMGRTASLPTQVTATAVAMNEN